MKSYLEQLRCNCIKDVSMLPICFEAAVPIIIRWVKMEHEELVFEWILEQSGLFRALTHVVQEARRQGFDGGFQNLNQLSDAFWIQHLENYVQVQVRAEELKRREAFISEPHPLVYPNGDVQMELFN
ncbi:hypothetical protein [Streptococcus vestibularis]|uniref:Uncharacterized protein n=1 Tax=Streptococcus salivarius TaxID=1304 RepID=H2D746_STRSL|nr:hypothetical protein [Streptococcus salivarius]